MNKKLGLLLAPLLPLTAIGIVEVANAIVRPEPVAIEAAGECKFHEMTTTAPPQQHIAPAAPETQLKA